MPRDCFRPLCCVRNERNERVARIDIIYEIIGKGQLTWQDMLDEARIDYNVNNNKLWESDEVNKCKWITVLMFCLMVVMISSVVSAAPLHNKDVIELWPGAAPGTENPSFQPTIVERSKVGFLPDRIITKITNPSLTAFVPEKPNGVSVIVAPGGAYSRIVLDKEAAEVANWLNPLGVTVFVLQYRLPCDAHINAKDVPLEDGQRAVRVVRKNAGDWGLNPNKIGLLGFSAAGHLAASVGAQFDKRVYQPVDAADSVSARPDFLILMYPIVSMDAKTTHLESRNNLLGTNPSEEDINEYSPYLHVTKNTPPTFIALANDDSAVPADNGALYYLALRKAGVEGELHIFKNGEHGFGITRTGKLPVSEWPSLCQKWLTSLGVLK